jgi:hypothetical protein
MKLPFFIIGIAFILGGCSTTEPVRTLQQGKHQITVSLGMQNTYASHVVTFPYFSFGYFHGITDGFTLGGNVYPLVLISGNIGLDFGGLFRIINGNRVSPELSAGAKVYFFSLNGFNQGPSVIPALKLGLDIPLSKNFSFFTMPELIFGSSNFSSILFTPSFGVTLHSDHGTEFQIEAKWMALGAGNFGNSGSNFQWNTTGQNVAIFFGLFFGNIEPSK